jgi:hypothetical protein
MSTRTTNYNLTKPDQTDYYDVDVNNMNMDIIDFELKSNKDLANSKSSLSHIHALNSDKINGILPVTKGGTGANTVGGARTALGLGAAATRSVTDDLSDTNGNLITAEVVGNIKEEVYTELFKRPKLQKGVKYDLPAEYVQKGIEGILVKVAEIDLSKTSGCIAAEMYIEASHDSTNTGHTEDCHKITILSTCNLLNTISSGTNNKISKGISHFSSGGDNYTINAIKLLKSNSKVLICANLRMMPTTSSAVWSNYKIAANLINAIGDGVEVVPCAYLGDGLTDSNIKIIAEYSIE